MKGLEDRVNVTNARTEEAIGREGRKVTNWREWRFPAARSRDASPENWSE
jgi:hypothetical protein